MDYSPDFAAAFSPVPRRPETVIPAFLLDFERWCQHPAVDGPPILRKPPMPPVVHALPARADLFSKRLK